MLKVTLIPIILLFEWQSSLTRPFLTQPSQWRYFHGLCTAWKRNNSLPFDDVTSLREGVDSRITSATNMVKVYLSTQTSSLSAFVIWKTHTVAKKSRGRQLNANVCGVTVICVPPVNVCPQTHFPSDIHSPKQISLAYLATLALFPRVNCSAMIKGKKIALFQDRTYMMQGGTV